MSWFVADDRGTFIHETSPGICSSPVDGQSRILEVVPLLGKLGCVGSLSPGGWGTLGAAPASPGS